TKSQIACLRPEQFRRVGPVAHRWWKRPLPRRMQPGYDAWEEECRDGTPWPLYSYSGGAFLFATSHRYSQERKGTHHSLQATIFSEKGKSGPRGPRRHHPANRGGGTPGEDRAVRFGGPWRDGAEQRRRSPGGQTRQVPSRAARGNPLPTPARRGRGGRSRDRDS